MFFEEGGKGKRGTHYYNIEGKEERKKERKKEKKEKTKLDCCCMQAEAGSEP